MCLDNICDLLMSLVTRSVLLTERLGGYISLKCRIYFKMYLLKQPEHNFFQWVNKIRKCIFIFVFRVQGIPPTIPQIFRQKQKTKEKVVLVSKIICCSTLPQNSLLSWFEKLYLWLGTTIRMSWIRLGNRTCWDHESVCHP